MRVEDFKKPQRVWINCPSTLQPYHDLHAKVGIAVIEYTDQVRIHFTEGAVYSMMIDPLYLSPKYHIYDK